MFGSGSLFQWQQRTKKKGRVSGGWSNHPFSPPTSKAPPRSVISFADLRLLTILFSIPSILQFFHPGQTHHPLLPFVPFVFHSVLRCPPQRSSCLFTLVLLCFVCCSLAQPSFSTTDCNKSKSNHAQHQTLSTQTANKQTSKQVKASTLKNQRPEENVLQFQPIFQPGSIRA